MSEHGELAFETTSGGRDDQTRLASFEAFVDASRDAFFSQDVDGRIAIWNRSVERIFGYYADEVVGEPVIGLFSDHVRAEVESLVAAVIGGDRLDHLETEIRRKDGMPVPISLSLYPVRDPCGAPLGFVGVARDLTEQRLAQAALAETEARLREAEALAHAGRWLWDLASGAVQWSEEMHRIHGVDPAIFEGTLEAHLAAVLPEDVGPLRGALAAAVDGGRPLDVEYRIVRSDGARRWLYSRAEPTFGSIGTVVGLSGFAQDVTDRGDFRDPELDRP